MWPSISPATEHATHGRAVARGRVPREGGSGLLRRPARGVALTLTAVACGCGAVVDGSYRGEPLATLSGNIVVEAGAATPPGDLRVALFWSGPEASIEQDVVTTLDFPARYTLTLYSPPPDNALFEADYTEGGPIALSTPLLYEDQDGDGQWTRGLEPVIGASVDAALVYVTGELELHEPAAETGLLEESMELHSGYHVLEQAGYLCAQSATAPLVPGTGAAVDIILGDYAPRLLDVDCDGDSDEWGELEDDDDSDDGQAHDGLDDDSAP